MADHRDLTDSDGIHEPKGITSAAAGQIYVANGSGTGLWKTSLQEKTNYITSTFTPSSEVAVPASNTPILVSSTYGTWSTFNKNGDITQAATGEVTFPTAGSYRMTLTGRASPNTNVGASRENSALQVWENGTQPGTLNPGTIQYTHLQDTEARSPVEFNMTTFFTLAADDTVNFYHMALDNSRDMWYDRIVVSFEQVGA